MTQIEPALIVEINRRHAACEADKRELVSSLIRSLNRRRELGLLLQSAKAHVKHGQWESMFAGREKRVSSNGESGCHFKFTREMARLYMRLADKFPEPITALPAGVHGLRDVLANPANGLSGGDSTDRNAQALERLTDGVCGKVIGFCADFLDYWGKLRRAPELLTPERVEAIARQLEPIVDVYDELQSTKHNRRKR